MSNNSPFLLVVQKNDEAIGWASRRLRGAGFRVANTFDLQVARRNHSECPCPHHGTEKCDCQMAILLVYEGGQHPVSLIAHSYDGCTWFSFVDTPQQRLDPRLESAIMQALIPYNIVSSSIYDA